MAPRNVTVAYLTGCDVTRSSVSSGGADKTVDDKASFCMLVSLLAVMSVLLYWQKRRAKRMPHFRENKERRPFKSRCREKQVQLSCPPSPMTLHPRRMIVEDRGLKVFDGDPFWFYWQTEHWRALPFQEDSNVTGNYTQSCALTAAPSTPLEQRVFSICGRIPFDSDMIVDVEKEHSIVPKLATLTESQTH